MPIMPMPFESPADGGLSSDIAFTTPEAAGSTT